MAEPSDEERTDGLDRYRCEFCGALVCRAFKVLRRHPRKPAVICRDCLLSRSEEYLLDNMRPFNPLPSKCR